MLTKMEMPSTEPGKGEQRDVIWFSSARSGQSKDGPRQSSLKGRLGTSELKEDTGGASVTTVASPWRAGGAAASSGHGEELFVDPEHQQVPDWAVSWSPQSVLTNIHPPA